MSFSAIAPYLLSLALTAAVSYLWNMQRLTWKRIAELTTIVQQIENKKK